jgi:hypothetical protein
MKHFYVVGDWGLIGSVDAISIEIAWYRAVRVFGRNGFSHITLPNPPGVMGSSPSYVYWARTEEHEKWKGKVPMLEMLQNLYGEIASFLKAKSKEYSERVYRRKRQREYRMDEMRREYKKQNKKYFARRFSRKSSKYILETTHGLISEMSPTLYRGHGIRMVEGHPYA